MPGKEAIMIELSEEQRQSINEGKAVRVQQNGREYILQRPDIYERLAGEGYDDSPWDVDEMDRLREESVALLDRYGKNA
jgi:hypothetical protein